MTIEELETLVWATHWFEHLCESMVNYEYVQIPSLGPWTKLSTGDTKLQRIADQMDWLPSSKDEVDPIYGKSLEERCEQRGKKEESSRFSLDISKKALVSLRRFEGQPSLKVGPHNFTEAARGAALYACRRAAYEVLLGDCGFWCSAMSVYRQGRCPCGILPNGVMVVL